MKTIFDNRLFCVSMSLACAWFMYQDYSESSKINILNLIYFIGFTFLALYRKNKVHDTSSTIENNQPSLSNNKKDMVTELNEEKELQLTKTFTK